MRGAEIGLRLAHRLSEYFESIRIIVIAIALYIIGWVVGRTWMIWFPVSLAVLFATVLALILLVSAVKIWQHK